MSQREKEKEEHINEVKRLMARVRAGDAAAALKFVKWLFRNRYGGIDPIRMATEATMLLLVEEGHVPAMTSLGKLCRDWGRAEHTGGIKYAEKGIALLEQAVAANDPEACYTLANIKMNKSKAEKKKEPKLTLRCEAAALYEKAAQQEHPWACFELAKMCADGKTIPQDLLRAYKLVQATKLIAAREDLHFDPKEIGALEATILRDPKSTSLLQGAFSESALGLKAPPALPPPPQGKGKSGKRPAAPHNP